MLQWFSHNALSLAIFMPLVGGLIILSVPRRHDGAARYIAVSVAILAFAVCAYVFVGAGGSGEFQFVHQVPWIPSLGIHYRVGADGASAVLIAMTALLVLVGILSSWREIRTRTRLFYALLLFVETGLVGVFAALDMFLFFVFWDMALIPMCFVIGIWGSGERIRAAMKYLIFTVSGSLVMLVALLYVASRVGSFDLIGWYAASFSAREQFWLFLGFALAFAIKVPLFGLHTWLPDAHTEAPTAGSIILAGAMLKVGAYGLFRVAMPLFPQAVGQLSPIVLTVAVVSIIAGALLAMVQTDLKRLIAYSSITHMGFVVLGLFALERYAVAGALFQMVSHGLIIAGLFAMAGFLGERRGTRLIADYGGSAISLPMMAMAFIVLALAAAGLPPLSGFVAEFFVLMGSFQSRTPYAAAAVAGVVMTACYLIWLVKRLFFGPLAHERERTMPDLTAREYLCVVPLIAAILIAGVWPKDVLGRIWRSADAFVSLSKRGEIVVPAQVKGGDLSAKRDVGDAADVD